MKVYRSIVNVLCYVLIFVTVFLSCSLFFDYVDEKTDEAMKIEAECRDGDFDTAYSFQVENADDGSYTISYSGSNNEMVVKAHYDANGKYSFTEKISWKPKVLFSIYAIWFSVIIGMLIGTYKDSLAEYLEKLVLYCKSFKKKWIMKKHPELISDTEDVK